MEKICDLHVEKIYFYIALIIKKVGQIIFLRHLAKIIILRSGM